MSQVPLFGIHLICCFKWKNFHKCCNSLLFVPLMDNGLLLFYFGKFFSSFHSFPILIIYYDGYWCILFALVEFFIWFFLQLLIMLMQFILLLSHHRLNPYFFSLTISIIVILKLRFSNILI